MLRIRKKRGEKKKTVSNGRQIWPDGPKNNRKNKKLTAAGPYSSYLGTKEWTVIENSLKDLEVNQDIKITTVPEYVTGYIVKKLRDEGLIKGK